MQPLFHRSFGCPVMLTLRGYTDDRPLIGWLLFMFISIHDLYMETMDTHIQVKPSYRVTVGKCQMAITYRFFCSNRQY